jgi:hypothetical protein
MADIFISYSNQDRSQVMMLAAFLEAKGFTTWWDTELRSGEVYRDEIMTQLAAARAVIVIWTKNSILSDFVRAEAGRAKAEAKLIPVKQDDVSYQDIPLPFGEMHTERLANQELIREAVVALFARPPPPAAVWKRVRFELLAWLSAIGAAVSFLAHLQGMLNLSLLSRYVVQYWANILTALWSRILFFVPNLSKIDAMMLSIVTFTAGTLFLSPIKRKETRRQPVASSVLTALTFAILVFIFAAGTIYSQDMSGTFRDLTAGLLSLMHVDFAVFNHVQQAVLLVAFVLLCVATALLGFIAVSTLVYRNQTPTHEADVSATAVRLHRIIIGMILLALLNQLSWPIEQWLAAQGLR